MTTLTHDGVGRVTGGVDTHKVVHVAAVIDSVGRLLATAEFTTTSSGYRQLLAWMRSHGELVAVGVEGCGSWGAGLARHLSAAGVRVVEVNRPNRQNRRRRGKSDVIDAEAAARAVLAGDASVTPKAQTGPVEAVRQLRVARAGAMKARTAAANQLHSLCDTAPDVVRSQLVGLPLKRIVAIAERWRPGDDMTVEASARARPAQCRSPLAQPRRRSSNTPIRHPHDPQRDCPWPARRARRRRSHRRATPRHRR